MFSVYWLKKKQIVRHTKLYLCLLRQSFKYCKRTVVKPVSCYFLAFRTLKLKRSVYAKNGKLV